MCRILDDVLANRPTERDALCVAVDKAFEALIQHEQRWVPVTERLPESSVDDLEYPTVIICGADGTVTLACYYESTKEWGCGEYFNSKCFPIAWMPLPKWKGDAE